jgi:hypothetical protein
MRITRAVFAPVVAAAAVVAMATGAMASTTHPASIVGDRPSAEQVGQTVSGGQIEKVTATVYLRNAGQYASEVTSFGDSLQLLTSTRQITLGMSAVTSGGGSAYSPGLAVFDRSGTAPTDLVFSGNSQFGSFSAPHGHSVRMVAYYSKQTGVVHVTVLDIQTGLAAAATYDLGLGASIREADVSNEFGCYADSDPRVVAGCGSDITSPAVNTKLATFSQVAVTNYLNKTFTCLVATSRSGRSSPPATAR